MQIEVKNKRFHSTARLYQINKKGLVISGPTAIAPLWSKCEQRIFLQWSKANQSEEQSQRHLTATKFQNHWDDWC